MNYENYTNVLTYLPKSSIKIRNDIYDNRLNIYNIINDFCETSNNKKFLISLSGGVDSMVIASIIHYLGYDVVGLHLNYNNREETNKEQDFIEKWCYFNNIKLYVHNIENIKRSIMKRETYEEESKQIRFDFYKTVINKENADGVILAHHKDDTIENIITNICRARSILNLGVFNESTKIQDVNIRRPLLNIYKNEIYEFAHDNEIPYFKDTTPNWSIRGILRNHIMPSLISAFKHKIKDNLLKIDQQTKEWNELINMSIIDPFIEQCEFHDNTVRFNLEKYISYPSCFWNVVFMKIFYKYKLNCPSHKSITTFIEFINNKKSGRFILTSKAKCKMENFKFEINFG